ncbi:hypothetical protein ACFSX5_13715 [Devosia albogilva]|uniref:UbiC transcription regulator-associated domain-containing protein n=1 Tax=Devosia albogilva TaxID=429726 RepID=A0ABW5QM65_9HYPH
MVFEVIDLLSDGIVPGINVEAVTPEEAVLRALGVEVKRNGTRRDLVARVYWHTPGNTNMVRLYRAHSVSPQQPADAIRINRDHQT